MITAMLICGCGDTDDNRITMSDICVFRQRSDGVPVKTVLTSGITSTVCVDPLCMHDAECLLYDSAFDSITLGDTYCFVSGNMSVGENTGERSGEVRLCAYNMTSGEIRVLQTYRDSILPMYGYDHYLYYSVAVYSKTDEGIKNSYSLFRADIDNSKIIGIPTDREYSTTSYVSTADFPSIYTIDDGRIYWYAPSEDGYLHYTTDLAGKNYRELPINDSHIMNGVYHDGFAYYTLNKSSGSLADCKTDLERLKFMNQRILRRCNMETGADELVAENIAAYIVTDDGIFYTMYQSEPQEMKRNGDTYYDIFAGRLYRMNLDGSGAEPLCTLDGVDLSVSTQLFLGYADGKLALAFMDEVQNDFYDSGYDYSISSDIIIVDTTDGTWRFSEDET